MQSLQTPPSNAFSGFCLLHTISHQVFHGSGVHRFRFPQFSDGWFVGERDCWHLCAIDRCIPLRRRSQLDLYPHLALVLFIGFSREWLHLSTRRSMSASTGQESCTSRTCLKWSADGSLSKHDHHELMKRLCASDPALAQSAACSCSRQTP